MFLRYTKKRKRGASLLLVPRSIGLRIAPICRNEQCWKPHVNAYIIHPPYQQTMIRPKPMRAVYNTPCEASPLLCFLTDSWSCEVHRPSKPKRQLRLYLCICIPTLAQSWAFSKDYDCKDNDIFWKLYQKEEKIIIIFSVICPKMYLSASFWWKKRQINRKWDCKKQLCHNIPNVLDCFITFSCFWRDNTQCTFHFFIDFTALAFQHLVFHTYYYHIIQSRIWLPLA